MFYRNRLPHFVNNSLCCQGIRLQNFLCRAGTSKFIRHTVTDNRNRACRRKIFRHRAAQAPNHVGFLCRYNTAGLPCCCQKDLCIQGLQRMHVDDPNGDSLSCQLFRRLQGHLHHHTHSYHGNILVRPGATPPCQWQTGIPPHDLSPSPLPGVPNAYRPVLHKPKAPGPPPASHSRRRGTKPSYWEWHA